MDKFVIINGIGQLSLYEVYEYYDMPILFSCVDVFLHKYLIMQLAEENEKERWMCMKISDNRLNELKLQNISLKRVFESSENSEVMILIGLGFSDNEMVINTLATGELNIYDLPTEEYLFNAQEIVGYIPEQSLISLEAKQKGREMFFFRLIGNTVKYGELATSSVAIALKHIQDSMSAIGLSLQQDFSNKGKIPTFVTDMTQLNFAGIYKGSYGLKFVAKKMPELLPETSLLSKSYGILNDIINKEGDISDILGSLQHRALNKVRGLCEFLESSELDLNLGYVFPTNELNETILTKDKATILINNIDEIPTNIEELLEISGILKGIDIDKYDFSIYDASDNIKYDGKIDSTIIKDIEIQKAQVNKKYLAKIKKEQEQINGKDYTTKYILTALSNERK